MKAGWARYGGRRTRISDTLVAVLKEAPDWSALTKETPSGLRRLLRRCLEKDQRKRWRDAADTRLELEEALETGSEERMEPGAEITGPEVVTGARSGFSVRRLVPWLAAAGTTAFATSNPRLVFDDLDRARLTTSYDIALAGDAILIPLSLQDKASMDEITVLVNWLDEIERSVPAESLQGR